MAPQEKLLTAAEAAERLGVSVSTINRLAASGQIPTAKKLPGLRGPRLFDPLDVDHFLAANEHPTPAA